MDNVPEIFQMKKWFKNMALLSRILAMGRETNIALNRCAVGERLLISRPVRDYICDCFLIFFTRCR